MSLQYADNTIIFSDVDHQYTKNLKSIFIWFEHISGMRINFHKSELIPMNVEEGQAHHLAQLFGCPIGELPIKYLGVPLHFKKLTREDIQPLIDKMLKRMAGWRGNLLSYVAKLILVKSCLASIPIYLLSFIKFPKWAIRILHSHLENCLWNDNPKARSYHLANWESLNMLKEYGGLGIPSLRDLNICLLAS